LALKVKFRLVGFDNLQFKRHSLGVAVLQDVIGDSENKLAFFADREVDCLHLEVEGLQPMAAQGKYQRAKFYKITKLGKEQLASDYERWGKMVATIEGIMTAK
jgi:hypothetical protein